MDDFFMCDSILDLGILLYVANHVPSHLFIRFRGGILATYAIHQREERTLHF